MWNLSDTTSRLSISEGDVDPSAIRKGLQESAISDGDGEAPAMREKRRRSSAALKKPHKRKLKRLMPPKIVFSEQKEPVAFRCIRDLVLAVNGQGNNKAGKSKVWLDFAQLANVDSITCILAPGIQIQVDDGGQAIVPIEKADTKEIGVLSNFSHAVVARSPGSKEQYFSPLHTLTNISVTRSEKKQIMEKSASVRITINDLLMSSHQRIELGYPQEAKLGEGWVQTREFEHDGSHIFAVDCEFCEGASGSVLTRVSVLNFQGDVVLDELVMPDEAITNYNTRYSGITKEKLEGVTTSLADIQRRLCELISASDILIGHSLQSDLNVMRLVHHNVVDTSIIYEHARGPPSRPSLRWLAQTFLARAIQRGEDVGDGHSSVEDAKACLDLVKLKISSGMCFGTNVGETSIFHRLAEANPDSHSLLVSYAQYEQPNTSDNEVTKVYATNDDEVVDGFLSHHERNSFNVVCLNELEYCLGWSKVPQNYTGKLVDFEANKADLYARMNARLQTIYDALPENALVVIFSRTGDPAELHALQEKKRIYQRLVREGVNVAKLPREEQWDVDKQQNLYEACTKAKSGLMFVGLKETRKLQRGNEEPPEKTKHDEVTNDKPEPDGPTVDGPTVDGPEGTEIEKK